MGWNNQKWGTIQKNPAKNDPDAKVRPNTEKIISIWTYLSNERQQEVQSPVNGWFQQDDHTENGVRIWNDVEAVCMNWVTFKL